MSDQPKQGDTVRFGDIEFVVVHAYGIDQAIAEKFDHPGLQKIWDDYLIWTTTAHDLAEEDRMFAKEYDGQMVWVIDDGTAITILRPEDY